MFATIANFLVDPVGSVSSALGSTLSTANAICGGKPEFDESLPTQTQDDFLSDFVPVLRRTIAQGIAERRRVALRGEIMSECEFVARLPWNGGKVPMQGKWAVEAALQEGQGYDLEIVCSNDLLCLGWWIYVRIQPNKDDFLADLVLAFQRAQSCAKRWGFSDVTVLIWPLAAQVLPVQVVWAKEYLVSLGLQPEEGLCGGFEYRRSSRALFVPASLSQTDGLG